MEDCGLDSMRGRAYNLAIAALFSSAIFVEKILAPPPYDKFFSIFIESLLLCIGFMVLGFIGPISIGFISGLLLASVRGFLAPFTIILASIYGLLISFFSKLLKVREDLSARGVRLALSSGIASAVTGTLGTVVVFMLGLAIHPLIIASIFIAGLAQGVLGGYLAAILWNRFLRRIA
jgi:hypothetical protein